MRKIILALSLAFPLVSQASPSITCTGSFTITGEDVVSLSCSGDLSLSDNIFSSIATIQEDGSLLLVGPFFDRGSAIANGASIVEYQVEDDRGSRALLRNESGLILNIGGILGAGSYVVIQGPDYPYAGGGSVVVGDVRLVQTDALVSPEAGIITLGSNIISSVPEPSTYSAMLLGLVALGWMSRRRKGI